MMPSLKNDLEIKNKKNSDFLLKCLIPLVFLKLFILIIRSFGAFSHPQIIRQTDTLGVSLRYWLRWTQEPNLYNSLLPAVLTSGEQIGISPMELPVLNILLAPFFSLGLEWGRSLSFLFIIILNFSLLFYNYKIWRGKKIFRVDGGLTTLLLAIFTVSGIFIGKLMPDFISFMLVQTAIGLSWNKPKWIPSFLFCALGLLIKPPSVVALGIFLGRDKNTFFKNFNWIIPSIVITLIYYTIGTNYLKSLSDVPDYFYVSLRNPITSLVDFIESPKNIFLLFQKSFFPALFFWTLPIFGLYAWSKKKKKEVINSKLLIIFFLQILIISCLDGFHSFIHYYYFIGASFVICLIFLTLTLQLPQKTILYLVFIPLLIYQVDEGIFELRHFSKNNLYPECQEILKNRPELNNELKIRTNFSFSPTLGLCLGKIQNSNSSTYAVLFKKEKNFAGCNEIYQTKSLKVLKCQATN